MSVVVVFAWLSYRHDLRTRRLIERRDRPMRSNISSMPAANDCIQRITIEARFGSDIQRDVSMRVLKEFLTAWKANVESAHKKNNITINETGQKAARHNSVN
jgi:hypothetical protein